MILCKSHLGGKYELSKEPQTSLKGENGEEAIKEGKVKYYLN